MKVIISRKGFDSENGGFPSPILPNDKLVSFPIPSPKDATCFANVAINGIGIADLVCDLTDGTINAKDRCHLDPDLDAGSLPRLNGWRPAFGQIDAAQGHLQKQGVDVGDLFLFFGWFRRVQQGKAGRWEYVAGAQSMHVLYGWLRVGQVVRLGVGERPSPVEAFAAHPHLHGRERASNALYLAADTLAIGDVTVSGAGLFTHLTPRRTLTDLAQNKRSLWRLPRWMHPDHGTRLSYHGNISRWEMLGDCCRLSSVAKGQEFVLNAQHNSMWEWIHDLF